MAFPKAPIKRFNEPSDDIPGVGSYNLVGDQQSSTSKGQKVTKDNELHAQIVCLKLKLKEAQDKYKSLDNLLSGGKRQNEMLEKQCQRLRKELSLLKRNIESEESKLKKTIADLQAEIVELKNKGTSVEQEHRTLLSQLAKERQTASVLHKDKEALQTFIVNLQKELNEAVSISENKLASIEEERDTFNKQLVVSREESSSLKLSVIELQKELESVQTNLSKVVIQLEETKVELEKKFLQEEKTVSVLIENEMKHSTLQLLNETLQDELKQLQEEKTNLLKTISRLNEENVGLEQNQKLVAQERDSLLYDLEVSQKDLAESKDEMSKLKVYVFNEKENKRQALDAAQSANEQLVTKASSLVVEIENLRQELSSKAEEALRVTQTRMHLETLMAGKDHQLVEYKLEVQALMEENDHIQTCLLQAQKDKEDLISQQDRMAASLLQAQKDKEDLISQQEHMAVSLLQAQRDKEDIISQQEHMEASLLQAQKDKEDVISQLEHMAASLLQAQRDKEDLISQQEQIAASLKEKSEHEHWKLKFEELERKIEPFREALDMFELEKKLLLERDKYTHEQMEKLTKEAIKNMGHQNHRQKVKYVDNLKKENLALHKKCQETHEELQRQIALVKKYKEKLEKPDCTKHYQTPCKPRIPLKEGNKL